MLSFIRSYRAAKYDVPIPPSPSAPSLPSRASSRTRKRDADVGQDPSNTTTSVKKPSSISRRGTSKSRPSSQSDSKTLPAEEEKPFDNSSMIYMTHTQELLNAISMLVPPVLFVYYYYHPPVDCFWNQYTVVMVFFSLLHLPFSFFYHLFCFLGCYPDRIDSRGRKLDQTFIHIASCSFSYSLSGDGLYTCGTAIAHLWFISKLWVPGPHDRPFERRMNILVGILMYVLPMAWRGDVENTAVGVAVFTTCALLGLHNKRLGGNGHFLSHVLLGAFVHFLLLSAAKVPDYRKARGQRWVQSVESDVCYDPEKLWQGILSN